jgi:hypothetical protein
VLYPLSYGRVSAWKASVYQRLSVVSRRVVAHRRMVHRRFVRNGCATVSFKSPHGILESVLRRVQV